jgi:hypothetical protein
VIGPRASGLGPRGLGAGVTAVVIIRNGGWLLALVILVVLVLLALVDADPAPVAEDPR